MSAAALAQLQDPAWRYRPHLERCRAHLVAGLAAEAPAAAVLVDYFERGKLLRALTVFSAAAAVGSDPEAVMAAAVAIELLHGASLFHDDLIDRADERRGLPALHVLVGPSAALVLGDYLLSRAFSVLAEARALHPAARVLDAMQMLARQAQRCCRGQLDELLWAEPVQAERAYLEMVACKTAAPFVAAATCGAILGGAGRAAVEQLADYARNLGIAFQICDDMLDLLAKSHELGKPAGNSLANGRPLLPLIYLGGVAPATRNERRARLEREGVCERVRATQQRFLDDACAALEGPFEPDGVAALRELLAYATLWR